jgi:hypothetical protein
VEANQAVSHASSYTRAPLDARERSGERHLTSKVTVGSIVKLKLTAEKTLLFQKAENLESHSPLPRVDKLKGLEDHTAERIVTTGRHYRHSTTNSARAAERSTSHPHA